MSYCDIVIPLVNWFRSSTQRIMTDASTFPLWWSRKEINSISYSWVGGAPVNVTLTTSNPVTLTQPDQFFGDSDTCDAFWSECQLQFICKPGEFPSDAGKVMFIISYLDGNCANWSITLIENNDPLFYDFPKFNKDMWWVFAKHAFVQDNEQQTS